MGSSSLAAMTLWCRVLALLAIITFVVSNQNDDTENRALDTSLENSLNLDINHVITKRDAKDPEKNKRSKRKNLKKRKRLEKQKKTKFQRKDQIRKEGQRERKKTKLQRKDQGRIEGQRKRRKISPRKKRRYKVREKINPKAVRKEKETKINWPGGEKTRGKKVIFEEAEQHLLWAIGGDIDNPICGPSDKSSSKYNSTLYEKEKNLAVESYKLLKECDIEIEQSCNISNLEGYNKDEVAENITICQDMMEDAIAANKLCQSLTEDVAAQCTCWINQTILIDQIKELKCQAKADQKKVTQFKNKCIETFKACKKMEDKSVESVYYCMEDHSMKFINQTVESLANAADKNSKTAGERAAFADRNQLQLQEYLDDNLISLF